MTDFGDIDLPFVTARTDFRAGLVLTDLQDPRHQFVSGLRQRIAQTLHQAAQYLNSGSGVSNVERVDCSKMMMCVDLQNRKRLLPKPSHCSSTMKTLLLDYPLQRDDYESARRALDSSRKYVNVFFF